MARGHPQQGVSHLDVRPLGESSTAAGGTNGGPTTTGTEHWRISRRGALGLMAAALAAGATPWAGADSAAAASSRGPGAAPLEVIAFSGAHTTGGLTVSVIALAAADLARVRLYEAASGQLVATSPQQTIGASRATLHSFPGLQPNKRYKYVPELRTNAVWTSYTDEGADGQVGWCWTMPVRSAATYARKVALLGCQKTASSDGDPNAQPYSYDRIWNDRDSITDLVHLGDFHYMEITSGDPTPHVDGYKTQLTYHPHLRRALRVAGLIYTPSDHEAGPNNGESGGAKWTLAGHQAIKRVFPMHSYLVSALADKYRDLTRVVECGRMLWVFPDFRNYQRKDSATNFQYEKEHYGDSSLKYRAYGRAVTDALVNAMDTWRAGGGIVVFWSDPVPYSQIVGGEETELINKTDAYASYPATRRHLFPRIDEGIFSDYHNVCDDDGTYNRHGDSGWFGCSGQWVQPTFRGGSYQYVLHTGDEPYDMSVYATVDYVASADRIVSTKQGYQTHPAGVSIPARQTTFPATGGAT